MGQLRHIRLALRRFKSRTGGAVLVAPMTALVSSTAMALTLFGDDEPATLSFAEINGPPIEVAALPAWEAPQHRPSQR